MGGGEGVQAGLAALASPATRLAVLLFTDIVDSTGLKSKLGTRVYTQMLARHNALFDAGLREIDGARIIKHTGDGYFATFGTASDAVRFALLFQARMRLEPWEPRAMHTRVGVHIGEVMLLDMAGRADVVGFSADVAARIMSLALGGQILLTAQAFNDARQFVSQAPEVLAGSPPLRWVAHGHYAFQGSDEPLEVYEVGVEGFSPLAVPPDSDKVRRVVPHDQEPTLGWRPAIGLEVPNRPGWAFEKKLGDGGFGEVWLGHHRKLGQRRVFKFCFDADRVRSFKRELTLFRLLRGALGEREDIAKLYDYKLDQPPFFLESEYTAGGNLIDWSQRHGGIGTLPIAQRLELVAKVADAVAAAHSVGVLHKDIKPSNILIQENPDGSIFPRLADFGIGIISDNERLKKHALNVTGVTQLTEMSSRGSGGSSGGSSSGTPMYAPPESQLAKPFTTHGDVYALGVLAYQMAVGDLHKPLGSGWEKRVPDELLREDIAAMVEGDPEQRIGNAGEVATRIRSMEHRKQERERQRFLRESLRRRKRLTRVAIGAAAALAGVVVAGSLYVRDLRAERARTLVEQRRADMVSDFLIGMLRGADQDDGRGANVRLIDVLNEGLPDMERSFAGHPVVKARIQFVIAEALDGVGQRNRAIPLYKDVLKTRREKLGDDNVDTIEALTKYSRVLQGREAESAAAEAMERARRVLGDAHPVTLLTVHNYGSAMRSADRYAEAEKFYKEAMDGRSRLREMGETHHDSLESASAYCGVLRLQGRPHEAVTLAKRSLELARQKYSEEHPVTLRALSTYASILVKIDPSEEVVAMCEQVLDARTKLLGENHRSSCFARMSYANALAAVGRDDEAAESFRKAVELAKNNSNLGKDDRVTRRLVREYLAFLDGRRRVEDAAALRAEFGLTSEPQVAGGVITTQPAAPGGQGGS